MWGGKGIDWKINGYATAMLHFIVIPCTLTVLLSTPFHSSDRRLQVVNNVAETGLVWKVELSCNNNTNFQMKKTACSLFCPLCEFRLRKWLPCHFLVARLLKEKRKLLRFSTWTLSETPPLYTNKDIDQTDQSPTTGKQALECPNHTCSPASGELSYIT